MTSNLIEIKIPVREARTKLVSPRQKQKKETYNSPHKDISITFHSKESNMGTRVTIKGFRKDDQVFVTSSSCIKPDNFSKKQSNRNCDKAFDENRFDMILPNMTNKEFVTFAESYANTLLKHSFVILNNQLKVLDNVAKVIDRSVGVKHFNPDFQTINAQMLYVVNQERKKFYDLAILENDIPQIPKPNNKILEVIE